MTPATLSAILSKNIEMAMPEILAEARKRRADLLERLSTVELLRIRQ